MNMLNTGDIIVIATSNTFIYFFELDLNTKIREIELTNCSVKLFDYSIIDLVVT
jgi:hypothetical protein